MLSGAKILSAPRPGETERVSRALHWTIRGAIFPVVFDSRLRRVLMRASPHTPTTSSWNMSFQRQIGSDWLVSATYIGTETSHIWSQKALNPAIYIHGASCTLNGITYNPCSSTANTNQRRRFSIERPVDGQSMANGSDTDAGGTQSYHGMLLSGQ